MALLDGLDTDDSNVEPKAPSRSVPRHSIANSADIDYYLHTHGLHAHGSQSLESDEADTTRMLDADKRGDPINARQPLASVSNTKVALRGSRKAQTKRLSMHDLSAPAKLRPAASLAEPESSSSLPLAAQPRERRRRSEQLLSPTQPIDSAPTEALGARRSVPTLLDEDELENDAVLGIYQDTDVGTSWNVQGAPQPALK